MCPPYRPYSANAPWFRDNSKPFAVAIAIRAETVPPLFLSVVRYSCNFTSSCSPSKTFFPLFSQA